MPCAILEIWGGEALLTTSHRGRGGKKAKQTDIALSAFADLFYRVPFFSSSGCPPHVPRSSRARAVTPFACRGHLFFPLFLLFNEKKKKGKKEPAVVMLGAF